MGAWIKPLRSGSVIAAGLAVSALLWGNAAPKEGDAPELNPALKINQLQVLGTHNSYSEGIDPRLVALFADRMAPMMAKLQSGASSTMGALFKEEHPNPMSPTEMLKYDHPGLKEQLDLGVRSLEIDINPDPKGGHYSDPVGYRMLHEQGVKDLLPFDNTDLDKSGFKVLHIPDIDFRSHCPTLQLCLSQIRSWSDAHPDHVPLFIMIEAKIQDIPILPNPTHTVPFTPALFDALDKELVEGIGRDKIITPDDVRGSYATLNQAVLAGHWPTLKAARGKVLFLLMTATGPAGVTGYLAGHPGLKGRMAFLRSEPGEDYGAFLLYDNALVRGAEIRKYVSQGYLVRTRSDIETYEAKINDMTRAKAAFASGAQIVSTDFERPTNSYGTSYRIGLPDARTAQCNPVNVSAAACLAR